MKRLYYARQIRTGAFRTSEPEFARLTSMVTPGDWVLDIGANVGHYTLRLSSLVGQDGRVVALEPVPESFDLLSANTIVGRAQNVSLINAAASDAAGVARMTIPKGANGLDDLYLARMTREEAGLSVLRITVDSLQLPHAIRLAKIDTEGHELAVLKGMRGILLRDHPLLIVEDNDPEVSTYLAEFGYSSEKIEGSANRIYRAALSGAPQ